MLQVCVYLEQSTSEQGAFYETSTRAGLMTIIQGSYPNGNERAKSAIINPEVLVRMQFIQISFSPRS